MTEPGDQARAPATGSTRKRGPYANGQQRREEFVSKALELFASQGFQRLSLRRIAEALGVSHAALSYHFSSKEELLEAVFEEQAQRERPALEQGLAERGILDLLPDLLEANKEIPELIRLDVTILAEAVRSDHSAHAWADQRMEDGIAAIAAGLAVEKSHGRLRADLDPEATAHQIAAMVRGLQLQWLYRRDLPLGEHLRSYLDLLRP